MAKEQLARMLMYAGLLPFWGCVLVALLPLETGLDLRLILVSYGAVIVSFIAGIHWGIYLHQEAPVNLFLHSNIAAVLAWVAVLLPWPFGTPLLVACFIYLLAIDRRLFTCALIDPWFMAMRIRITALVVAALLVSLFSSSL